MARSAFARISGQRYFYAEARAAVGGPYLFHWRVARQGRNDVMMLRIGYFAEPSAPDVRPTVLLAVSNQFGTYGDALVTAQQTARDLEAHSFSIDWPSGTSDRYFKDGDGWRLK